MEVVRVLAFTVPTPQRPLPGAHRLSGERPHVGFSCAKWITVWKELSCGYLGRGVQVGRRLRLSMVPEWSLLLFISWIIKSNELCVDEGVCKEG